MIIVLTAGEFAKPAIRPVISADRYGFAIKPGGIARNGAGDRGSDNHIWIAVEKQVRLDNTNAGGETNVDDRHR